MNPKIIVGTISMKSDLDPSVQAQFQRMERKIDEKDKLIAQKDQQIDQLKEHIRELADVLFAEVQVNTQATNLLRKHMFPRQEVK